MLRSETRLRKEEEKEAARTIGGLRFEHGFRHGASRRRASRFSGTEEKHGAGVEGGNLRGISNKHHHCMLIHKYALTTVQARVQTSCAVRACVRAFSLGQSASPCIPTLRVSRGCT